MRIIAVNHRDDPKRRAAIPENWDIHVTNEPIGATYYELTQKALRKGWGLETVVVQDDVRFLVPPEQYDHELVVYGQGEGGHVCPKAFAATQRVWRILGISWGSRPESLCGWWLPVVDAFGVVLNQTKHLEPVRSKSG